MTLPIFAIRPEPGCTVTVERGRHAGLEIEACPLFEVQSLPWDAPPRDRFDGLLFGSANAVRRAGPGLAAFRGMQAFAVGRATAAAAEAAGLSVAAVGQGGLQSLLPALRRPLTLLRLAGEEHLPLRPPLGVVIDTCVVYRSEPLPMPDPTAAKLRRGGLVLLHSAAAARHFASECDRLGIPRGAIALAALGPRIAQAAGDGWRALRSAGHPHDAALLALARDLCHEPPPG